MFCFKYNQYKIEDTIKDNKYSNVQTNKQPQTNTNKHKQTTNHKHIQINRNKQIKNKVDILCLPFLEEFETFQNPKHRYQVT